MSISEQEKQQILDQVYSAEISLSAKRALEAVVGAISTEVNIVQENVTVIEQTVAGGTVTGGGAPVSQYVTDDFFFFTGVGSSSQNNPASGLAMTVTEAGTYVIEAGISFNMTESGIALKALVTDSAQATLKLNGVIGADINTSSASYDTVVTGKSARIVLEAGDLVNFRIDFTAVNGNAIAEATNNNPGVSDVIPIAFASITKVD